MASSPAPTFYALISYEDPYVQPLILSALSSRLPPNSYTLIPTLSSLPSRTSPLLQFQQYEALDWTHVVAHPSTSLANAYVIRKALIRKHYLSTTCANWITKHPDSVLAKHVQRGVEFEVDYAEFLDDALDEGECWEVREAWGRNEGKDGGVGREWWILKPGMSERGQGIRLFSSEEELRGIFEEWDPPESDEEDEEEEGGDGGDGGGEEHAGVHAGQAADTKEGNGIITSQLRHFIAQPYIHPPLLIHLDDAPPKKFHIRTYVLAVGALRVFVYKPMLALFAARPYVPPWESANDEDGLRAHLTNTCLQETGEREGSVSLFWSLPSDLSNSNVPAGARSEGKGWKEDMFDQICTVTGEVFEAAARSMGIHFQPLPNAFELFGLDFLVGVNGNGTLAAYLLEVNAFPDFRQTGEELKGLVQGLFEGVVDVGIAPFFGHNGNGQHNTRDEKMVKVLDIDLGRR